MKPLRSRYKRELAWKTRCYGKSRKPLDDADGSPASHVALGPADVRSIRTALDRFGRICIYFNQSAIVAATSGYVTHDLF